MELWDVLDVHGHKTGETMVRGMKLPEGANHLVADVWIKNSKGEYLISRRSPDKEPDAGLWSPTCGSVLAGEGSYAAGIREAKEEIGISLDPGRGRFITRTYNGKNTFFDIWLFEQNVDIDTVVLQAGETDAVMWADAGKIKDMMDNGMFLSQKKILYLDLLPEGGRVFTQTINGVDLSFDTAGCDFSPHSVDAGTIAMLACIDLPSAGKILDLGCGYGVVGIYAAKIVGAHNVVMSDIDAHCVMLADKNAIANGLGCIKTIQSDGFKNIDDTDFMLIMANPPYHSDFSVPKHFIEKGFNRLSLGGNMALVTKRKEWYKNKLISIFGGVKIKEVGEYFVFLAEKRSTHYAKPPNR